ncbi:fibronectin type III domain protein [Necator americanus]|uniref:Fibronectin type III domain protein n=1 Tax=Necator americanus TaxID=51031 RepID=W2TE45_NECAM|nr:fibronectin type III domain protein [Necator americanus]ETN79854.1 fibronectin type III domain protein [Necator americanus]
MSTLVEGGQNDCAMVDARRTRLSFCSASINASHSPATDDNPHCDCFYCLTLHSNRLCSLFSLGAMPSKVYTEDGTVLEYLDVNNSACEACESGCHQHRRSHGKGIRGPSNPATDNGHRFWMESSADIAKAGSTLVSSVQLLCQNPSLDEEFGESSEGFVAISLLRPSGPTRFVLQWKQRTQAMGFYDESQWITASVESDTLFKVKGLIPGVQYRFMVTAIGPGGRLGETIASSWTEISNAGGPRASASALTIRNGYNSDRGITAHLEWPRTAQDSCYYKLQLSNSTLQLDMDIVLDASSSILLPHLEFDCNYAVSLATTASDRSQIGKPSATSAIVDFPGENCEYVVRLVNYDVVGRDAVVEARVVIESTTTLIRLEDMLRPESLFIALCFLLFVFLCVLIRCKCGRKCPNRVSEKQHKLTEYP